MSSLSRETIENALRHVTVESGQDVISMGLISGFVIKGGKVGFLITIDPKDKDRMAHVREACEKAVAALPGVESVTAVLTAQGSQPIAPKPEAGYTQPRERAQWNLTPLEGVKKIIAIASGKGGVGKSTTAVNLAFALQRSGKRVGLLDADIYGPSIPRMLGLAGQPEIKEGKMVPLENQGIACMSMGFITGDEAAILRGPMISKSLQQMLRMTRWDDLDVLLVDMPPGTGDIHLSMVQQVPLAGAIIVTTPQAVATIDAKKCLQMFRKVGTPVLGVIENMSGGMFGSGGGKALAEEMDAPFLGAIPMDAEIVTAGDGGEVYRGACVGSYAEVAKKL